MVTMIIPGRRNELNCQISNAMIATTRSERPDDARRAHHTLHAATQAGLAATNPGAVCAEVFQAMLRVIASYGGNDADAERLGLGLSMRLTEWPSLTRRIEPCWSPEWF